MNKEERTGQDIDWLNTMSAEYESLIKTATQRARWAYNPKLPTIDESQMKCGTRIFLKNMDTITCANSIEKGKLCILDFASYRSPGGGFLKGAIAQEEDICRHTLLYPVLDSQRKWYNRHYREGSDLYSNDYLYCRKVPIIRDDNEEKKFKWVDFLVMAAPRNTGEVPDDVYDSILYLRQLHAYLAPITQNEMVDTLILGAWGCGVFKNDPEKVAVNWRRIIEKYNGLYKRIYHPIPDKETLEVFEGVYDK